MLKTLLISMIFVMGTVGITTSGMAADNHYHDNMHELDHHLKISNLPKIAKGTSSIARHAKVCGSLPEKFTLRSTKAKIQRCKNYGLSGIVN